MENQGHCLTPFQRKLLLNQITQTDLRPEYYRRIKIMLMADLGQSQTQICADLKCSKQTARYWMNIAQKGLAHCWHECPMGPPKVVNDEYRNRLKALVSHDPREYGYSFRRWSAKYLAKHLEKELGIKLSDRHVSRLLKEMGFSTQQKCSSTQQVTDSQSTQDARIIIRDLPSSILAPSSMSIPFTKAVSYQQERIMNDEL